MVTYGVGDGLAVGCGVAVEEPPQPVTAAPAFCRAPAPKLLRIASPIADWSSVIGPIDSATYPSRSYLWEEAIGLKCLVMTSGDGSFVASTELATAGTKAAAINNIGRSEASSREYSMPVST